MIEIDGSYGEGGGQVLRTSLSLAALLGEPLVIRNIRAGRPKPGLAAQHVTCVRAAAAICGAEVHGDEIGSGAVEFAPDRVQAGDYHFDVADVQASAGSACLVLQTLLPPLLFADGPSRLHISGGTHVPWSPAFDYIMYAFLPAIRACGARVEARIERGGWYPRGGGKIEALIEPLAQPLQPCEFVHRGEIRRLTLASVVSRGLPDHIAGRQLAGLREAAAPLPELAHETMATLDGGPGTAALIAAEFDGGFAGFGALGERGRPAEQVGAEAGSDFARFMATSACIDAHLADQMMLYLALADGHSAATTPELTLHQQTNAWVIGQFLPAKFASRETGGGPALFEVTGTGRMPGRE